MQGIKVEDLFGVAEEDECLSALTGSQGEEALKEAPTTKSTSGDEDEFHGDVKSEVASGADDTRKSRSLPFGPKRGGISHAQKKKPQQLQQPEQQVPPRGVSSGASNSGLKPFVTIETEKIRTSAAGKPKFNIYMPKYISKKEAPGGK